MSTDASKDTKPESSPTPTPTPSPFPTQVLCSFINSYNGERDTLVAFLTNCENAINLANAAQKELLFKFIFAKLEGKAQIACSNRVFEKFEDLREFLKQNFGERKHYNHLLLDLQSCKQQQGESVTQFALRVESCLTDLQSEVHNSTTLKKDISGRIAMTEDLALHTFILGLHPKISNIVRCRTPKNLNAAVNAAIEEEKIQNFFTKSFTSRMSSHCEADKRGRSYVKNSTPSSSPPYSASMPPRSYGSQKPAMVCAYCKKPGHHISQCRRRAYNNNKFDNTQQNHVEIINNKNESSYEFDLNE